MLQCNIMVWFSGQDMQLIRTTVLRCSECWNIAEIWRSTGAMAWSECIRLF